MFKYYHLLLVLAAWLCASCAAGPRIPDTAPRPVLTREKPFGPSRDFETLVNETLNRQYTSLKTLLQEPASPEQTGHVLVALENPVLILQSGVTAMSGGADYLAAGYKNGNIRVWSSYPCSLVTLPDMQQVDHIWWKGDSRYLLAAGRDSPDLFLFDLNRCAAARGPEIQGRPVLASISEQTGQLVVVDAGRRILTASLEQEPAHRETLRYEPLDLAFTPGRKVLMLADAAGWLTMWTMPGFEPLDQVLVPGGPFNRAVFSGSRLVYDLGMESQTVWDISKGEISSLPEDLGLFILEQEFLYFVHPRKKMVKKVMLREPELQVLVNDRQGIILVRDLDQKNRYYQAASGLLLDKPLEEIYFRKLSLSSTFSFAWNGNKYTLADPVKVTDRSVLWARQTPDSGFYLWWSRNPGLESVDFSGRLPVRESIKAENPPLWEDIPAD